MQDVDQTDERETEERAEAPEEYMRRPVIIQWPPGPLPGYWDCKGDTIKGVVRLDREREVEVELTAMVAADWEPRLRVSTLYRLDSELHDDFGQVDRILPTVHTDSRRGLTLSHDALTNLWTDAVFAFQQYLGGHPEHFIAQATSMDSEAPPAELAHWGSVLLTQTEECLRGLAKTLTGFRLRGIN